MDRRRPREDYYECGQQKVIVLAYEVTRKENTNWNIIDTESLL